MNRSLTAMLVVARKELIDFARDRRTFLMTLLLTPLLFPTMMLGMGKLTESKLKTQLEKPLEVQVEGIERAPNLVSVLGGFGIVAKPAGKDMEARIRDQRDDVALVIDPDFAKDWRAGKPAKVEIVTDSTRRDADVPVARLTKALEMYSDHVGATRLMVRGIDPSITKAVSVGTRDLATPESKRGMVLAFMLPYLLLLSAFLGGSHLSMDTTAGERERQTLEPLLTMPTSRAAIVSGKMLSATVIGLCSLLLILLALKGSALLSIGMSKSLDVSLPAIAKLLFILLPLVIIGTGLITFVSAGAKSMKEAQSHNMWMMMLPMVPSFALMAYPLKDTQLWQYAVPFLAQNQMVQKVTRGEAPSAEQWLVYLGASLGLALILWLTAIWRYRQEKLAIAS